MFQIPESIRRIAEQSPTVSFRWLTAEEIVKMPDAELLDLLGRSLNDDPVAPQVRDVITHELMDRALKRATRTHWTTTPSFALLVASVVIALTSLVVGIAALHVAMQPQAPQPGQTTGESHQPASRAPQTK